ncbi:DUF3231 family protein [Rossellomorea vietnamensis]|uniref:Uncharacterized protein n=1 Tax=Rossellomorea vietnamensis TaxID=218284 RepID=A0A0P6WER4_9BACI|nr:hypothetical protein AM506_14580 [Rossellomorea vietnamensis]
MEKQDIRLTTSEISALWTTYIKCLALNCIYTHFLTYLKDESIISLVEDSLNTNVETMGEIEKTS